MRLTYGFLAQAATSNADGSFSALNAGRNDITVPEFPVMVGSIALLAGIEFQSTECDAPHMLHVEFWNPDGQPLLPPVAMPVTPARNPADPTRPVTLLLVMPINALQLAAPGDYGFHLMLDNAELGTVVLYVRQGTVPGLSGGAR